MPLPVINGTVRVSVQGLAPSGQKWVNNWHFRYTGGASNPGSIDINNLDAILLRIYSGTAYGAGTPWFTLCTSAVSMQQITYTPLDGTSIPTLITHTPAGSAAGNTSPSEVAVVATIRTLVRGKRNRGRIYLPCPASVNIGSTGTFASTAITSFLVQVQGAITALGGPSVAPFWELGVASYATSGPHPPYSPHFTPVSAVTMDGVCDVQRRRKS